MYVCMYVAINSCIFVHTHVYICMHVYSFFYTWGYFESSFMFLFFQGSNKFKWTSKTGCIYHIVFYRIYCLVYL